MQVKRVRDRIASDFIQICCLVFVLIFLIFSVFPGQSEARSNLSAAQQARIIAFNCQEEKFPEQCYSDEFGDLTAKTDIDFAKKTLLSLQAMDTDAVGCHLIAHTISITETAKNPSDWLELLKSQDYYFCSGGFLHGVLEAHSRYDSYFELTPDQFGLICSQVTNEGIAQLSCYHNLGHILLTEQQGDIEGSIVVCDEINDLRPKYECLSGVFMENLTRLNLITHGYARKIPWDEPNTREVEKLCLQYEDLAATACWKEISYMYISINNADPAGVFESCKRAPEETMQDQCFLYGAGNMIHFTFFDPADFVSVCDVYDQSDNRYKTCMFQVIGSQLASSEKLAERAISLCEAGAEWFKVECFSYFSSALNRSVDSRERRIELCEKTPEDFRDACTQQVG